jgi:diacylglycerol kinase
VYQVTLFVDVVSATKRAAAAAVLFIHLAAALCILLILIPVAGLYPPSGRRH